MGPLIYLDGAPHLPCSECRTLHRVCFLRDASDLAPLAGMVCDACEDALIVDAHDDEECGCRACKAAYARIARSLGPAVSGGFAPGMLTLVFGTEDP